MNDYLTICIPTRNRANVCLETIKSLELAMADDVRVVVSDNSDHDELPAGLKKLYPSGVPSWLEVIPSVREKVLSMRENWERTLNRAETEWVCFIGDDDFVDPNVVQLLRRLREQSIPFDAFTWSHMNFHWPEMRSVPTTIRVNLGHKLIQYPTKATYETLFGFQTKRPLSGTSIYHGCLHKSLVDKVRNAITNDGVFFKHSNTDYITGWLAMHFSQNPAYSYRPLSVSGACAESNSAYTRQNGGMEYAVERFKKELSSDTYVIANTMPDRLAKNGTNPATLTEYFYELTMDFLEIANGAKLSESWKKNLLQRGNLEIGEQWDPEVYSSTVESLAKFFKRLDINNFSPVKYSPPPERDSLARGFHEGNVYIPDDAFGSSTPFELYQHVNELLRPIDRIGKNIEVVKRG